MHAPAQTAAGPMTIDTDDVFGKNLRRSHVYEQSLTWWLDGQLKPGMVAVDAGANIGYFTVLMARAVGPTGRVLAVEPDPRNVDLLRENVAGAGVEDVVTVAPVALSDRQGEALLHRDGRNWGAHALYAAAVPEPVEQVPVVTATLDACIDAAGLTGRVDLVKMDIQGAEWVALLGASTLLAQPRLLLVVELWPHGLALAGASCAEVRALLKQAGFVVKAVIGPGNAEAVLTDQRSHPGAHANVLFVKES